MGLLSWLDRRKRTNPDNALHERLEGLERAVERLAAKQSGHSITIENLHVHNPSLEQLTFRLDRLDIDELSGALNLGNNFGTRVGKKEPPLKTPEGKQAATMQEQPNEMKKTASGFKFETGKRP